MAYNLLGQQGNKGDRNPDPNLTAEQATYLYDTPPGSGDNKGLTNAGKPVDKNSENSTGISRIIPILLSRKSSLAVSMAYLSSLPS